MDTKAFWKMSYGLYIISAKKWGKSRRLCCEYNDPGDFRTAAGYGDN